MPRRLTAEERQLRDQIKLLAAHLREERRTARAEKKAAEAAKPKRPAYHGRIIARFKQLRTQIKRAEDQISSDPKAYASAMASASLPGNRMLLACMVRDYSWLLALELAGTDLPGWSEMYLAEGANTLNNGKRTGFLA